MPYDSGLINPDGSYTFTGPSGSLTTAPTPASDAFLATLQRRQEQSAPLAANGPTRPPLVMSDAPLDMSPPRLPGAPSQVGFYGQSAFSPDTGAAPAASVVPGLAPGAQISFGDGGQANVAPGGPPRIESGASSAETRKANEAFVAREQARSTGGSPASSAVGAVDLVQNPNAVSGTGGRAGGPGQNAHDVAMDLRMKEADWYLKHPGGGGSGPRPGTYQTGQAEKIKTNGGKDPDSVLAMAESNRAKAFADRDAAQASAAYEGDVQSRMQFERFLQQGADDNLARKKKEAMDTFHADLEAREKEINETEIDPGQFWADKSTGAKIGFVLAAALTGALNGAAGKQGNQVIDAVNKRVDEDINAQIRNLGTKKEGLTNIQRVYQQAKERWGDEGFARNQAKILALTAAEKLARQQASLTRGEAAAAAADKFYADVANKKQELIFNSQGTLDREVDKQFKVVSPGASGSGGGSGKNPYSQAANALGQAGSEQDASKKYNTDAAKTGVIQRIVVGGSTYDMPNTGTEEGGKVRTTLGQADMAEAALKRIEQRSKDSVAERFATTASDAQKNDIATLTEIESMMKGQGVVKEPDIERKMSALLSVRSGTDTIKSTRALINDARTAALRQGGAVPVKAR